MNDLPVELLSIIASFDNKSYRACLVIPLFAQTLNYHRTIDFKIRFGYSIKITSGSIKWYRNHQRHRDDGPSELSSPGYSVYPAIEYANSKV